MTLNSERNDSSPEKPKTRHSGVLDIAVTVECYVDGLDAAVLSACSSLSLSQLGDALRKS